MSMSKKDFEAIAAILRGTVAVIDRNHASVTERCAAMETLDFIGANLANHCAQVNPNFDRARFLRACGIGD